MSDKAPTEVGRVRHVLGSRVTVELDPELAGTAPIFRGRLQSIGQIGSLVRIPQGLVDLIAAVELVGISELAGPVEPTESVQHGERWIQVQLLGEVDRATGRFQRGVGAYPGLDDSVHFATADDLGSVFPRPGLTHLRLGRLAATESVPVCVDPALFVVRHSAVVGSTGSGKTSAVASVIQSFVNGGWDSANIVVVDPHGEYARALSRFASIKSVLASGPNQLRVPYWALPAEDVLRIFAGSTGGSTFLNRFSELVTEERRNFVSLAKWLSMDPTTVTSDTPVPFDIRKIWHLLDAENNETLLQPGDRNSACVIDKGDPETLRAARFNHYGAGSQPPHKGPFHGAYGTTPELLRLGLLDPQLQFFQEPKCAFEGSDPLVEVMHDWLGHDRPVSVLDFSGVPSIAADLAIGVVLNLLFEVSLRCDYGGPGIGRPSPVLVVLEEAHRYLGDHASALTRDSANRIAREGRKYGVGLMLVTQRPKELPGTALAQCGTIVALRLSNSEDQGTIRAALPDSISGLASVLSSLRTGEGVVSGDSVILPARVLFDLPNPRPQADDPSLCAWRSHTGVPNVGPAISRWRETFAEAK